MAHESINNLSSILRSLESRAKAKAEEVANEVQRLWVEITKLIEELDDRNQRARVNNVEIRNITLK